MEPLPSPGRRRALRVLACGALLAALPAACGRRPGPPAAGPARAVVPLAALDGGARVRVTLLGRPVEVRREGDAVVATSLRCTHWGCDVRWDAASSRYLCACHDGVLDAEGRPMLGPVTKPLVRYPAAVEGDSVVVRAPAPTPARGGA